MKSYLYKKVTISKNNYIKKKKYRKNNYIEKKPYKRKLNKIEII